MLAPAPDLEIQAAARLLAEGRPEEAVPRLEALTAAAPAYAAALVLLARAYEAGGRPADALAAWHRAHFLVPTSPLIRRERQRLLDAYARAAAPPEPGEEAPPLAATPGGDLPDARLALADEPGPAPEETEPVSEEVDEDLLSEALLAEAAAAPSESAEPATWTEAAAGDGEEAAPAEPPEAEGDEEAPEAPEADGAGPALDRPGLEEPPPPVSASPLTPEPEAEPFTWLAPPDDRAGPPVERVEPAAEGAPAPLFHPEDAFGGEDVFGSELVFPRAPDAPGTFAEEAEPEEAGTWPEEAAAEEAVWEEEPGDAPSEDDAPALQGPPAGEGEPGWTLLEETEELPPTLTGAAEPDVAPPAGFSIARPDWTVVRRTPPVEDVEPEEIAGPEEAEAPEPEEAAPAEEAPEADDLDALIRQLEGATRIRPDPHFVPPPPQAEEPEDDLDDDLVSETLARIYAAQHQYAEAAGIYEKLARQRPAEADAFLRKAAELRARGSDTPDEDAGEPGA